MAILVTMGGDGKQGATEQIKIALDVQGMEFVEKLIITGKDQKSGEWAAEAEEFTQYFME